jgi:tRNA(Ile)-lysidine synthase
LTTSLFAQVQSYIQSRTLVQPDDRILVGVSGGPDSTALLHLLHRLAPLWSITLGVVHFDHCLRGAASGADARWVADLAASLHLPCYSGQGDVRAYKASHKISLQTAARELRQHFFQEIRQKHGYRLLALGHTADDQVELFFLRLLRGAGPEGIKGMWPGNSMGIIRPLLETSKSRIIHWLESEGLSYRLDDSNESRRYRRNQLRLDLLPQLEKYNPRFSDAVRRFQALLQEQEDYLHQEASQALAALAAAVDLKPAVLPLQPFLDLHPTLQKRVFRLASAKAGVPLAGLTNRHVSAALHLCGSSRPTGEISLPGRWRLVKENNQLSWQNQPPVPSPGGEDMINEPAGACTFLGWTFTWTTMTAPGEAEIMPHSPDIVLMDYQKLRFPLRLRTCRPGDRFQPLGMSGTKKLHDFFIDAKIPRSRRPFVPLLVSGDEIIWLAGQRLAESVKLTAHTGRLFKVQAVAPAGEVCFISP